MAGLSRGPIRKVICISRAQCRLRHKKRGYIRPIYKNDGKETEWRPVTELGMLVQHGIIRSLEEIHVLSLPIHEHDIVNYFLGNKLKEDVLKIMPVQKEGNADEPSKFKAIVAIGDYDGHIGLGVKISRQLRNAIHDATASAKLLIVPVRRGYWEHIQGKPHTIPIKVSGSSGSVSIRLIPAPRGTGIVAPSVSRKILQMAGIDDCYVSISGVHYSIGNIAKATYAAIANTYAHPSLAKSKIEEVA